MYLTINRAIATTQRFVSRNSNTIVILLFLAYIALCIVMMSRDPDVNVVSIVMVFLVGIIGVALCLYGRRRPFATPIRIASARPPLSKKRARFKRHLQLKDRARELIEPYRTFEPREFHGGDIVIRIDAIDEDLVGFSPTFYCTMRTTSASDYWLTKRQFVTVCDFTLEPGAFRAGVRVKTELLVGMTPSVTTDAFKMSLRQRYYLRRLKRNTGAFDEDRELKSLITYLESLQDFSEVFGR